MQTQVHSVNSTQEDLEPCCCQTTVLNTETISHPKTLAILRKVGPKPERPFYCFITNHPKTIKNSSREGTFKRTHVINSHLAS